MTKTNITQTYQAKIIGLEGIHEIILVKEYQNVAIVEYLDTNELAVAKRCDIISCDTEELKE